MTNTDKVRLGAHGPEVFPLALGCMGMGGASFYGDSSDAESIATIHAALERGVNLLDTGDFYGTGRNELLVGRALAGRRDQALVSVKFGALRGPDGAFNGHDARPVAVKNFLAHSLTRLGLDHVDIYRPARVDPQVPIEDTIGAIADLVKAGYVRYVGVSELGADTLRRAAAVHPRQRVGQPLVLRAVVAGAAGDRVGPRQEPGRRADHPDARRPHPGPARRRAGRARRHARRRRGRRARGRGAGARGGRHPLRRAADAAPRQRALTQRRELVRSRAWRHAV